jgi:hypothetical protein
VFADQLLVRAAGFEPAQALRPYGFSYHFGFGRRPPDVRGLDYPFTVADATDANALGAAHLVSTPSPYGGAWLGIACYRFPRF